VYGYKNGKRVEYLSDGRVETLKLDVQGGRGVMRKVFVVVKKY
jgi:hypothetical protein